MDQANGYGPGTPEDAFPPARVPWSPAQGLLILALFILIPVAIAGLGRIAFPSAGEGDDFMRRMVRLGFQLGSGTGAVLVLLYLFLKASAGSSRSACRLIGLRLPHPARALAASVVPLAVGVAAFLAWDYLQYTLLQQLGSEPAEQEIVTSLKRLVSLRAHGIAAVLFFLTVAVAPVAEELTFRGVLYLPLRARVGRVRAALLVSAVFAVAHGHLAGIGHLFILALVFTWLLEATKSMVVPILAHAAHNAVMIALIIHSAGAA